jgi:hypothetical protein
MLRNTKFKKLGSFGIVEPVLLRSMIGTLFAVGIGLSFIGVVGAAKMPVSDIQTAKVPQPTAVFVRGSAVDYTATGSISGRIKVD